MSDDSQRPIIVKKIKKGGHGHHGGAWKIAYADFVTAMMAFFLLMWLLGSTTKATRQGIADYFQTPLKVALMGGEGAGDATSLIKGGGEDLTRATGQVKRGADQTKSVFRPNRDLTRKSAEQIELEKLQQMKLKLEKKIKNDPQLKYFKNQLRLDLTSEGLRIQIVDAKNRPMFDSGRAEPRPYAREIISAIAGVLNDVPNKISLSGHTDATPYPSGDKNYSNWELSADRANSARRELIKAGLKPDKMLRVVGLADAVPLEPDKPYSPINRRISIIVLNKRTEESLIRNGSKDAGNKIDVNGQTTTSELQQGVGAGSPGAQTNSAVQSDTKTSANTVAPENVIPEDLRPPPH